MSHLAIKCILTSSQWPWNSKYEFAYYDVRYLCKIDCISVNIDQFSSKFRYVVAMTILYKRSYNYFSF